MKTQAGQAFDPKVADNDMTRIYALGDFERVSYSIADDPAQGRVLTADVVEKSWEPNYLRFGLGLSSDLSGDSFFTLIATHRWAQLNSLGGEWRNDVQIGHADRLGNRLARFRRATYGIGFDLGMPIGTSGEVRLGVNRGRLKLLTDTSTVSGSLIVPPIEMGGLQARLRLDTLDNLRFPRSGYSADMQVYTSRALRRDRRLHEGLRQRRSRARQRRALAAGRRARCQEPRQRRPACVRTLQPGRLSAVVGLPHRRTDRPGDEFRPPDLQLPRQRAGAA